jgi:hypothetical protein
MTWLIAATFQGNSKHYNYLSAFECKPGDTAVVQTDNGAFHCVTVVTVNSVNWPTAPFKWLVDKVTDRRPTERNLPALKRLDDLEARIAELEKGLKKPNPTKRRYTRRKK